MRCLRYWTGKRNQFWFEISNVICLSVTGWPLDANTAGSLAITIRQHSLSRYLYFLFMGNTVVSYCNSLVNSLNQSNTSVNWKLPTPFRRRRRQINSSSCCLWTSSIRNDYEVSVKQFEISILLIYTEEYSDSVNRRFYDLVDTISIEVHGLPPMWGQSKFKQHEIQISKLLWMKNFPL